MNSRQKGARGERELAKVFRGHGFDSRRSQQYCGIAGDSDVIGIPGWHVECKRVERLNVENALKQAIRDSKGESIPVVCHRKDRGEWIASMRLEDWLRLIKGGRSDG